MSIGPVLGYTGKYKFALVNFDFLRWHTYEQNNWTLLDAILRSYISPAGIKGIWANSTAYAVDDRVIDDVLNKVYVCLVSHTSASSGTFANDRTAHPLYWQDTAVAISNRGTWTPSTVYNANDFVVNGTQYAVGVLPHTSSASFSADVTAGKFIVLIDVSAQVTAAAGSASNAATSATNSANSATAAAGSATAASTSASAASTSATNAATSESNALSYKNAANTSATNAGTSETNAGTSATNAANSATTAANQAAALSGTSTTSVLIGTGAKTFTTQASKQWQAGSILKLMSAANTANYMVGTVTSYSGTSLNMNITDVGGSGTFADWSIVISGLTGPQGIQGAAGAGSGDVTGPASSVDSHIVVFNGTTGKVIKSSGVLLSSYLLSATAATTYQPLDADLTALAGLNATAGLVEQTGAAAFTKRLIGVANATDIPTRSDGDGRYGLLSGSRYTGPGRQAINAVTVSAGSCTVDASLSNNHSITITGNTTINFSNFDATANTETELQLHITNGGLGTLSFGSTINWMKGDGTTSTTFATAHSGFTFASAGYNIISIWRVGSTLYGRAN